MRLLLVIGWLAAYAHALPTSTVNLFNAHQKLPAEQLQDYLRFNEFATRHSKQYAHQAEVLERFAIYLNNHQLAAEQQANEQADALYGETRFMDLTPEEFARTWLGFGRDSGKPNHPGLADFPQGEPCETAIYNRSVPEEHLWTVHEGVVAEVKDQGACGSCWAFSTIGNIEGQLKLRLNETAELSEQILLDCDKIDYGCGGGLMLDAYKEIKRIGGLETEKDYPYESHTDKCRIDKREFVVTVTGSCQVAKDEEAIKRYLHEVGPLSIAVNANPLMFYSRGIHNPKYCSASGLNHAVLLVGYGTEKGTPYWLIKNSWGKRWGENGFYRLYRGNNVCGVREYVTMAYIAKPAI